MHKIWWKCATQNKTLYDPAGETITGENESYSWFLGSFLFDWFKTNRAFAKNLIIMCFNFLMINQSRNVSETVLAAVVTMVRRFTPIKCLTAWKETYNVPLVAENHTQRPLIKWSDEINAQDRSHMNPGETQCTTNILQRSQTENKIKIE